MGGISELITGSGAKRARRNAEKRALEEDARLKALSTERDSDRIKEVGVKQRRLLGKKKGRLSTVLTSGKGVDTSSSKKTLLGQ